MRARKTTDYETDNAKLIDPQVQVALRLIMSRQHSLGREFILEDANLTNSGRGIHTSSEWLEQHSRATQDTVWWCALGLNDPEVLHKKARRIEGCAVTSVVSTLNIPQKYLVCCAKTKFRPQHFAVSHTEDIL